MTLRKKTLIIIGLTLGILFLLLYVILSRILLQGFAEVEAQVGQQNVRRVTEALDGEVDTLASTVEDWAAWDESYAFVQDGNEQYVDENLTDSTLANLRLNALLFFNKAGQLVYGTGFDLENEQIAPLPASLTGHFDQNDRLLQHATPSEATSGLLLLPEGPLLVASYPILTSADEGPSQGSLVMGRSLNQDVIDLLENRTRFNLAFHSLDDEPLAARYQPIIEAITGDASILIEPLSPDQLAGYTLIRDVYGEPALLLEVTMPRPVYPPSRLSLRTQMISLAVLGVVFVLLTLTLLERLVLARVARLHEGVTEIGAEGDLSRRLTVSGKDELSNLAIAINKMLEDLQNALQREKVLRQEVQRLQIEIDEVKRVKQVSEITDSDFFRELQTKARQIRSRSQRMTPDQAEPPPEQAK